MSDCPECRGTGVMCVLGPYGESTLLTICCCIRVKALPQKRSDTDE